MRWTPGGESENIEDRRNSGGFGGFRGRHIGIGGLLLLGLLSIVFRRDLITPFLGISSAPTASMPDPARTKAEEPTVQFLSFVLDDAQNSWGEILRRQGRAYRPAKVVLFRDVTESSCGTAEAATGPFYCPDDEKVYLDLGFFDELRSRFKAPGQFAEAYVLTHEIGHHVQRLLGIEERVRRAQSRSPEQANAYSVRLELQADCFAGIWAHSTQQRQLLESGDVRSALGAAAAVGDDRIARMGNRRVSPETFTHGSASQRTSWLQRGLDSGSVESCNTFSE
jgi:uncharacterized protein